MNRLCLILVALGLALGSLQAQQLSPHGKLRMQFAAQPGFNPYQLQIIEHEMMKKATELWEERKAGDSVNVMRSLLQVYPLSLGAHRRLAEGYEALEKHADSTEELERYTANKQRHEAMYTGLMDSIVEGRDGKSPESAFPVITLAEEYWVLLKLGTAPTNRFTDPANGLDVYDVVDKDGNEFQIFFEISRVLAAAAKMETAEPPAPVAPKN